jgi:murein DD-endopeptidase MepM/ murein hydrolase activator NlpD
MPHKATKIVRNGGAFTAEDAVPAVTMASFLVCRHGGLIEPVTSGQENRETAPKAFPAGVYASVVSRGVASRAAPAGSGTQTAAAGFREAQCDGFLIVKDASGKENLVYLNDKTFLPIGYVLIEDLAAALKPFGYNMSVSNNNGGIAGYVNRRYYSVKPYVEEGQIVGSNGKTYGTFFVATAQNKCYVKLEQFMRAIGLEGKAKEATKAGMSAFDEVYANGEKKPFVPPSPEADGQESKYGFIWPTESHYVSGKFRGTTGRTHEHRGIDIGVMLVDVKAVAAGTVLSVGYTGARGNYIYMDHGNGTQTVYEHLDKAYVSQGQVVAQGHVIALSGKSGDFDYPYHLHFELLMGVSDKDTKKGEEPPFTWAKGTTGYHVSPVDYLGE